MNFIDLAFIAIAILFLVLGLFGKLITKIVHLICIIVAIPVSYLVSGWLMNTALAVKVIAYLKSVEVVQTLMDKSPSFESFINGSSRMIIFYVLGIIAFVVFGLIAALISGALKKNAKARAILSLGLIEALSAVIILAFITLPFSMAKATINTAYDKYAEDRTEVNASLKLANDQISSSKLLDYEKEYLLDKNLVPFLTYKVEGDEKEYNIYEEIQDLEVLLPTALDLANGLSLNNSIDMKDSNSIQSLLDTIENLLKPIDDARADLSENSHIKSVIAEYIEYFVEGMPTEVESMSMFKYAKDYLADFNYETESYIDNIPSALVQSYIDSNESSNAFLKFVDVSSYNYEKLSSELFKMPNLIKIFGSASNLSASDVKSALTSTDIAKQVVSGLLSEYYTDGSITEATLDYDKESSAIASALNYSNSSDDSLELSAIPTLIDSLCSSDLLPAILDFYSNNGSAVTIKVSLIKKTTIDGLFDTKVLDGELSQKVANTYKAMFTV